MKRGGNVVREKLENLSAPAYTHKQTYNTHTHLSQVSQKVQTGHYRPVREGWKEYSRWEKLWKLD